MLQPCVTLIALAATAAAPPVQRPAPPAIQEFALDAGHSIIEFSVGFALTRVKGRFTQARGTILYDPARLDSSSVTVVIQSGSIDTGWPHRDEHLRTSDFFDVAQFPTITFQSERLRKHGDGWIVEGPLTMHGVTRQIAIPFTFVQAPARSPASQSMILNAAGSLRLARKDFGIVGGSRHNAWFTQLRSATMADSVEIAIEIEGWLSDAESQRPPAIEAALERLRSGGVRAQVDRLRQLKATSSPPAFEGYFHGGDLLVRALIADGRLPEAVALSRALTELFPETASAYLVHGYALSATGDLPGAARQYALAKQVYRAPVLDPNEKFPQDDAVWYYNDQLVRTSLEWKRVAEGVLLARALTGIYPATARAHATYALALAMSGDTKSATESYAHALLLDPNETRAIEWKRRLRD